MPFWSKSQEKPASEADSEPVPEPTDEPKPSELEASTTAPATTNAPTPEDEVKASETSESTWGSRFNTAKQLYGTANQVYTVASAIPQARTALEPYLTKASTTEDPESKTESVEKTTDSAQGTPDIPAQHEKGISDLHSANPAADAIPSSETLARPEEEPEIKDDATEPISESSPGGESAHEHIAAKDVPEPRDTPAADLASDSDPKDEASADSPAASKSPDIETDAAAVDPSSTNSPEKVKTSEEPSSSGVASQSDVNVEDATSLHPETPPRDEALDASDLDSTTEKVTEISHPEEEASKAVSSKDTPVEKDVSAGQSGVEDGKEPTKAFRKGLVFARENSTEDSRLEDEPPHGVSGLGATPAIQSGTETKEDVPDAADKSLESTENAQSISTKAQESSPNLTPETAEDSRKQMTDQSELSSTEFKKGPQELGEVAKSEKPVNQIESPSQLEADAKPAPDRETKHDEASNTISQPANSSTEANDALPASSTHQDPESAEETSVGKASLEPTTSEDSPIQLTDATETSEKTSDPSAAETQPAAETSNPADEPEPDTATEKQQPTQEEIEKAADAAKAAARLQSTADTLWAQARAVRDPAERERLWRAAYNKEVEAHGQSKKARAMASGWGQGVLSGVGISSVVGVGLGNVVGALLSGVVSVPGSLIGAGVGAAFGPLVKLGGYGGSKADKKSEEKENDRPKEFDWEEDLSDDEEHRKIVKAVRMDEETAEGDVKDETTNQ